MSEESHLDAMRSAIRGDFERLASRRGEQELMRVEEPAALQPPQEDEDPEPAAGRRSWLARVLSS